MKKLTLLLAALAMILVSCKPEIEKPTVVTKSVGNVTETSAKVVGQVSADGGAEVTECGVCWNTEGVPEIIDFRTKEGTGVGSFASQLTNLEPNTTYYVRAYAVNEAGTSYGDEKSFTTLSSTGIINGHEWIDLGLPSGLKWATCNVGATKPEEYGNYYAWGETATKSEYTGDNSLTYGKQMSDISGNAQYDAATANWGGDWRMPTSYELNELITKCTWEWINTNDFKGYSVIGPNGNSIFLPAAGYRYGSSLKVAGSKGDYWSSSPYDGSGDYGAYRLYISSDDQYMYNFDRRYYGRSVRPVVE